MDVRHGAGLLGLASLAAIWVSLGGPTHLRQAFIAPTPVAATGMSVGRRITEPVPASLTLSGWIDELPDANATLTAHVGSAASAIPVQTGAFQITISGNSGGAPVWLDVQSPTTRYASVLGSYGRLARAAGADGIVTASEVDRLRVSPLSTALFFFLARESGGVPTASDGALERALLSVPGEDVMIAATVLHAFANGLLTVPQGFADGYALLEDRRAYADFVSANSATLSRSAMATYMAVVPSTPIAPTSVGQATLLSGPRPTSDPTMVDPGTRVLSRNADSFDLFNGSYSTLDQFNTDYAPTFLPSGDLQLVPLHDISSYTWLGPSTLQVNKVGQVVFRKLFSGDAHALWIELTDVHYSYPYNPELQEGDFVAVSARMSSNLDRTAIPLSSVSVRGLRSLPLFCTQGPNVTLTICDYALHDFQPGGVGATLDVGPKVDSNLAPVSGSPGQPFQWSAASGKGAAGVSDGRLQLTAGSGSTTYWRIAHEDAVSDLLVYVTHLASDTGTRSIAGQTAMLDARSGAGFGQVDPLGTWRYATFDSTPVAYGYQAYGAPVTVRFARAADGTELQTIQRTDDPLDPDYFGRYNSGWTILDGRMYDTRYQANAPSYGAVGFSSCQKAYAAGATQCAPARVRYFRPVAAVGNRLYGIEELYVRQDSTYTLPYAFDRYSRPTFYEKVAP